MVIDCVRKEILRHRCRVIVKDEITSFEQLKAMEIEAQVLVMNNCSMVMAKINSISDDVIYLDDEVDIIPIRKNSFQYGNFMYECA